MVKDWMIPIVCALLGYLVGRLNVYGRRKGMGEARFDSKTGKQIK